MQIQTRILAIAQNGKEFLLGSPEVVEYQKAHPSYSPETCLRDVCLAYEKSMEEAAAAKKEEGK